MVMDGDKHNDERMLQCDKSKSTESGQTAIKSVQSLPDKAFENSSSSRSSKKRFRKKGSPKADIREQGSSSSDVTKRRKSLGQQCRSFLSRLFRSKSDKDSQICETKSLSIQSPNYDPPFIKSLDSNSTQSMKLKRKPPIDVATVSPNNAFQIKSHYSSDEIRPPSNSFSTQSQTSSVKSGSSPTPKAIINISPTLKVVAITPTDDADCSPMTTGQTSNDCVVLNFTQTEVQTNPTSLKSVQATISEGETFKVISSSDLQKAPSPSSNKLNSSGYCVTVTPNSNSAYAVDYKTSNSSMMQKKFDTSENSSYVSYPSKNVANIQNANKGSIDGNNSNNISSYQSTNHKAVDMRTNLTSATLNTKPSEHLIIHKQPMNNQIIQEMNPIPRQRNKFSSTDQNFSSQLSRGREFISQEEPNKKMIESPDVLDEILNNAMIQLTNEGSNSQSSTSVRQRNLLNNSENTEVRTQPVFDVNVGTSKNVAIAPWDRHKFLSSQEYTFGEAGNANANFFSKEPLVLYSRNDTQMIGDTGALSPDSGVSSIQSPASDSLKGFPHTTLQMTSLNKPLYEFPDESLATKGSTTLNFLNSHQQQNMDIRSTSFPVTTIDSHQNLQHFLLQDRKLVNVVTPTPFLESTNPIPAPRHAEGRFLNNLINPKTNIKQEDQETMTLNPKHQPGFDEQTSKETIKSFPKVPPPSYKSVIVEGDPVDMARFKGVNFSQGAKTNNIYDMIPANVPSQDGIYEQIPFHKFNQAEDNVVRMTVEPRFEHFQYSLKPILTKLPKSNQQNYVRESSNFCFPTIVKPPIKDYRINEAVQQELREKLKTIPSVDDRYNRIKEEYLGVGNPSQTSYKPHHPQTFAPIQLVEESYDNHGKNYFSEDEIRQKKKQLEKIIDMEKQKKALRERLELQSRRHFHGGSIKSPTSSEMMRKDLMYDNIEPPRSNKVTKYKGRARALYNFKAQKARELSLRKGDIVYLLRSIDRNWFEGEHHGMTGIFPISYVEVLESIEEVQSIARMREGSATVLYDFYPRSPLELPLKKGYVVTLIKRLDNNWYEGRCGNKQGIFPTAYVSTIREPDTPLPTPCATPLPTSSPSRMNTPLPEGQSIPGWQSPSASSIFSLNPGIPNAPRSPTMFSVDFSRESTPFGGSVIGAPTYFSHRPSSVMSEPVHARECRTLPHNILKPLPTHGPVFANNMQPYKSMTMRENVYDNKDFSDCFSDRGWVEKPKIQSRTLSSPYKNVQAPTTFTSLNNKNSNSDVRTIRKKPTKLSFAPIPEKDAENEMMKPIIYPRYRVLHDFTSRSHEELGLEKNEIVRVVEKCRDGWYIGFLESTRQFGLFPGNFVELLKP